MNTEKHTTGPWTAKTFPPERGISHYVHVAGNALLRICTTGRWDSASAADARLIAAAPALLEALRAMIAEISIPDDPDAVETIIACIQTRPGMSEWTPSDDDDLRKHMAPETARAALALATGENPD